MTEKELAEILRRNPELRVVDDGRPPQRPPIAVSNKEKLVETFVSLWSQLGGPALVREFRFDAIRRWRFDFAHEGARVAIEINGGVWSHGRHVRGSGYLRDREKVNTATLAGWRVFELGTGQVTPEAVQKIIEVINATRDSV
jgi:very-short-patch-repair endonuclease